MPRLTRRDLAVASLTLAVVFVLPGATTFAPVKPKLELTPSKNAALTSAASVIATAISIVVGRNDGSVRSG